MIVTYYNRATGEVFSCSSDQEAFLIKEIFTSGRRVESTFERAMSSGFIQTRMGIASTLVTTFHNPAVL